jgi:hypothetical protein
LRGDDRRNGIFELMKMYPNVYTDISCIIEKDVLENIYHNYFINNPKMQEKFIYGSDFFLNMLWHKTFDNYYKDFTNTFSDVDFKLITITNPEKFLGV